MRWVIRYVWYFRLICYQIIGLGKEEHAFAIRTDSGLESNVNLSRIAWWISENWH